MENNFSLWNNDEVYNWLTKIKMEKYINNFQNHNINGYDLIFLNYQTLNELNINNFHDQNVIIKEVKKLIRDQLKLVIDYNGNKIKIQIENDENYTVEKLCNELKDFFKINNKIFISSNNEILMSNVKISNLILNDPLKYKNIKIINEKEQNYTNNYKRENKDYN
jgi:predicted house-cleaning noncanonical NTP pyrophosphatase (MazG superfamily)